MSAIGRNDPCPCGSGRKYKQCCLRATDEQEFRWRQLRNAEGRVIPELLKLALESWGAEGFHEAQRRFYAGYDVPADPAGDREFESLFMTWFGLHFAPKGTRGSQPEPAASQRLNRSPALADLDRRFLEEAVRRPASFHHITGVEPERWIDLEDMLTGETCRVVERSASLVARRGGLLFGRTLTLDGLSILIGCGTMMIPPAYRTDVQGLRERLAGGEEWLSREQVLALDDVLRRYYLDIADQLMNPPLPKLQNTDGDPLAPTTLHFELQCTPDEAFAALRSLNVVGAADPSILDEATRNRDGGLQSFRIDWNKAGNKLHRDWDNTTLGWMDIDGASLTASVNSSRRAKRLRREIEKRLAGRVMFVRLVEESVEAMMAKVRAEDPPPDDPPPPEVAAQLAEMMDRHWDTWLDEPVPALQGQTPREAAATAAGRERLNVLLDDFEWRATDEHPVPIARLRTALGL